MSQFASPIEDAMFVALAARSAEAWGLHALLKFRMDFEDCRKEAEAVLTREADGGFVYPHVVVGPYEVDFLVVFRTGTAELRSFAVECDGHEFHEKTKAQAAHDKKRDRYLALHSIPVLRFTGAEVWADADGCAAEVNMTLGFLQDPPRSTAWLGYLSDEEQERRMQEKIDAAELERYRLDMSRRQLAQELEMEDERRHARMLQMAEDAREEEAGLYP